MGLFNNKNTNEVNFVGGKKHFTDVIKNSGPGELLIWRQGEEDFNTNSTLIVMPGEKAVFIKGGNIEQVFDSGTYKLSTENYPFISRLRNAFSGGVSTFNCVVYFVRAAHSTEIKWGGSLQVRDKLIGIATKVRTRGAYKVSIDNPSLILSKLLGNNISFMVQDELNAYFKQEFLSHIKSIVTNTLNEMNSELLGVESRLHEISQMVAPKLDMILQSYGLKCASFSIAALELEDDELRRRYDEITMEATSKIRDAQAEKTMIDIQGEDWARIHSKEILSNLSKNEGAGGLASAGAGLGLGAQAVNVFGSMANQMFNPLSGETSKEVQKPKKRSGRFVQNDDEKHVIGQEDPVEVLSKLKKMLDLGVISQDDYDKKKMEVLNRM